MHKRGSLVLVAAGVFLVGCANRPGPLPAPLFQNLGTLHRPVSTGSTAAQRYFDQGLTLVYGFNHEEAIRSFEQAGRLDPNLAMAWWGVALAAGPNINNPTMDDAASKMAYEAVQHAVRLVGSATEVERDLINALRARYAWPPPQERRALDIAYADAMRGVWKSHPEDSDVGALFAEAMMDLRPWDLWTRDGQPQTGTEEIITTLETVLEKHPEHPGANHYYVHTMEASPHPERALVAAERLRDLVPGAGHLVHMPVHIYIRVGRYGDAVQANQRAIRADLKYVKQVGRGGFYTLYRAHNYHFLAYAAMFDGQREVALQAARDMVREIPAEMVRQMPDFLDAFLGAPIHAMVRFGLWEDILKEPEPPKDLFVTTAFWRYGRTVAFSALGRMEEAVKEFEAFTAAYANVPDTRLNGNNPAKVVLDVARFMAEGELEYRRGHTERAFQLLREAVRRDDALHYDEPWGWMQPVRHSLGALLLEQGRLAEAETVYREDLRLHPGNGWSLRGLAECLHRSGRHKEAAATEALFQRAWSRSDIPLRVSCFCRTRS
jgi:tetratricopeptide (TPR) repeat protein